MAASTPAQRRSLAIAALAGPLAWSTYFLVGYSLAEAACRLPLLTGTVLGLAAVSFAVLVLTAATAIISLYAGWLAYAHWRRRSRPAGQDGDTDRFLAVSGILLNGLFAFVTIATAVPALVLSPCW